MANAKRQYNTNFSPETNSFILIEIIGRAYKSVRKKKKKRPSESKKKIIMTGIITSQEKYAIQKCANKNREKNEEKDQELER